jgi:Flp pilus assembly pilin Flp
MLRIIKRFFKEEEGAAGLEYTLLATLVVLVVAAIIATLLPNVQTIWDAIDGAFQLAVDTVPGS